MLFLRWIICIPAAFVGSILLGAIATDVVNAFGVVNWYAWFVSGAASAFAFFWISFRIAPARPPILKWAVVLIIAALGLMAAIGPVIVDKEPMRAFAGVAMLFMAVAYSRMRVSEIEADLAATTGTKPSHSA